MTSDTALTGTASRLSVLCGLALAAATVMPWLAGDASGAVSDGPAPVAALWAGAVALVAGAVATVATWRLVASNAEEVERLRRPVDQDTLTGVARRAGFLARWAALLARDDGPAAGSLLVVRLADLAGLNRRLGRDGTDRALGVIAQLLQAYPARVPGCLVGRLNGADFALALPAAGLAAETGASIASALRAALGPFGRQAHVHVGGVEFVRGAPVSELLAHADRALAIAAGREPFGVEVAAIVDAVGGAWAGGQAA